MFTYGFRVCDRGDQVRRSEGKVIGPSRWLKTTAQEKTFRYAFRSFWIGRFRLSRKSEPILLTSTWIFMWPGHKHAQKKLTGSPNSRGSDRNIRSARIGNRLGSMVSIQSSSVSTRWNFECARLIWNEKDRLRIPDFWECFLWIRSNLFVFFLQILIFLVQLCCFVVTKWSICPEISKFSPAAPKNRRFRRRRRKFWNFWANG